MKDDINVRIIKKLKNSDFDDNICEFLIEAIREEFARSELHHWSYVDVYDRLIRNYSKIGE